jgi:hypothetical protein
MLNMNMKQIGDLPIQIADGYALYLVDGDEMSAEIWIGKDIEQTIEMKDLRNEADPDQLMPPVGTFYEDTLVKLVIKTRKLEAIDIEEINLPGAMGKRELTRKTIGVWTTQYHDAYYTERALKDLVWKMLQDIYCFNELSPHEISFSRDR